jgi:hypothetical protein
MLLDGRTSSKASPPRNGRSFRNHITSLLDPNTMPNDGYSPFLNFLSIWHGINGNIAMIYFIELTNPGSRELSECSTKPSFLNLPRAANLYLDKTVATSLSPTTH